MNQGNEDWDLNAWFGRWGVWNPLPCEFRDELTSLEGGALAGKLPMLESLY